MRKIVSVGSLLLLACFVCIGAAAEQPAAARGAGQASAAAAPAKAPPPAAAAQAKPGDPKAVDARPVLDADELFKNGDKITACQQVLQLGRGLPGGAQPDSFCSISLTCPDNIQTVSCTSASGDCSSTCGFVKCDGVKTYCDTPCCSAQTNCSDGSSLSCGSWKDPSSCSSTPGTSVTCNGISQFCGCSESLTCPDGTILSCSGNLGNGGCSETGNSVTCNGIRQTCPSCNPPFCP
jgi:hypothetical protein